MYCLAQRSCATTLSSWWQQICQQRATQGVRTKAWGTGAEQKFNQDLVSIQCGAEKVGERLLRVGLADLVVIHVFGALLSPGAGVWKAAWYEKANQ